MLEVALIVAIVAGLTAMTAGASGFVALLLALGAGMGMLLIGQWLSGALAGDDDA